MEFPHGHNHPHHHPHNDRDRREEGYPPPGRSSPPPFYGGNEPPPPPPQVTHVYHSSHVGGPDYPPPPPTFTNYSASYGYSPPPPTGPYSSAEHVSHQSHEIPHHHRPHFPSAFHHHSHHSDVTDKPSVRVYSKAETNYSLTIRDGKAILAPSNPSDPFQQWFKDEKFSTRIKDEEGLPCFALINKATGQAMKHSIGATHPVQLIPYNPDVLDESILWTDKDLGDGYRAIRMVNNIRLNVDAFNGDKNHGGVHDGTTIVLWEWKKGDNQRWKLVPH